MRKFEYKNKNQIQDLINKSVDNIETQKLINRFQELKSERIPFFLDQDDFEEILKWKLRSQYHRQKTIREKNTTSIIEQITKAAFLLKHEDKNIEAYFKIRMLRALAGVETAVASAILTLCFPDEFGVIDFRNWRQLFGVKKTSFSTSDYLKYINELKKLSSEHGFTIQQIDQAIWQNDINMNKLGNKDQK